MLGMASIGKIDDELIIWASTPCKFGTARTFGAGFGGTKKPMQPKAATSTLSQTRIG
jgi:hypothetical protein